MFHKRSLKRNINTLDNSSDDHSPSRKSLQPKRSRIENYCEQIKTQDDSSAVRRSSRPPKPKIFDDDYTAGVRSPGSENETLKNKEPRSTFGNQSERRSIDDEDVAKRRSSRVPKPKLFEEEYLETAKSRSDEDKKEKNMTFAFSQDWKNESGFQKGSTKSKKTTSFSKQADVSATAGGLQPQPAMKSNEGSGALEIQKVRTSSRTPMPKKTFALIDDSPVSSRTGDAGEGLFGGDLYVDIITQESHAPKHSKKMIIGHSDLSSASDEVVDIIGTSPVSSKKNWTSKDAGSNGGKHNKSKKLDTAVLKDIIGIEATIKSNTIKKQSEAIEKSQKLSSKVKNKTSDKIIKKSTTRNKTTDVSEDVVDVVGIQQMEVKKKAKKKKSEVEQIGYPSVSPDMMKTMSGLGPTGTEHGKKSSKHPKLKPKDEPHSEVKDKDHHIILKVHLPHGEPLHHSHHSHSHKKHKHKHSSETKTESSSSESKPKKPKSSHESDTSTSRDKQKKKISIKFKGLSSNTPGVEYFQGTEKAAKTGKKNKDMERVPKKKKPNKVSLDVPTIPIGSDKKEHVKVVIKKHKKDLKVIKDEGQKPSKKTSNSKNVTEKEIEDQDDGKAETPIKTTPKKKSKTNESPKSTEKEKRKIVSGYLLFCKKERSRIHEANPGLEFAQISQKVGEAWKSLPESIKQEWKAKADHVKKNLTPTKEDKKTEAATKSGPDPVDMAAHLKLLGESLSVIGVSLMAQKETEVHGSLSVLLDSILCAICPLTFLTSHIPGIPGISKETQMQILDDLAYTMPGLG